MCTAGARSELASKADIVIVGGGVVGLSLAYNLARLGRERIVLLERGELGQGSTARCAGGVRQQFSTPVNVQLQRLSVRLLLDFERELGASADFRQVGYLFLLTDELLVDAFKGHLQMWRGQGLSEARWLEPAQVADLAPLVATGDVIGATFCPTDGLAGPAEVTLGYASAARRLGVEIRTASEVLGIQVDHGRVVGVTTASGAVACAAAFICAGAWSRQLGLGVGLDLPVQPYRRQVFVTGRVPAMTREHPMVVDFARTLYLHPEGDGVLMGMADPNEGPGFDTSVNWDFASTVATAAVMRIPTLAEISIKTGWAGLYEMTPDHQPILGSIDEVEGLWCACGFSGHGFMQAPAVGLVLAQEYWGKRTEVDIEPLRWRRFSRLDLLAETNVI